LIASVGKVFGVFAIKTKFMRTPGPTFLDTVVTMRVAMMTREYPPEVYGGAGVHVTELVAQLRHLCEVDVHCMGAPRPGVIVAQPDPALKGANPALSTLSADLNIVNTASNAPSCIRTPGTPGWPGSYAALLYGIHARADRPFARTMRPGKADHSAVATGFVVGGEDRGWSPPMR